MKDNKNIRIRLYGQHLGYIGYDLYDNFLRICRVLDYSSWVKETAYKDFGFYIDGKDSIDLLKKKVLEDYYEDIADWLREKMRKEIKENNLK